MFCKQWSETWFLLQSPSGQCRRGWPGGKRGLVLAYIKKVLIKGNTLEFKKGLEMLDGTASKTDRLH